MEFVNPITEVFPAAPTPTAPGITQIPLSGVGVTILTSTTRYDASDWLAGGPDPGKYLTWGFETTAGYFLDEIRIKLGRSATGPQNYRIDMSVDGGTYVTVGTGAIPASPASINLGMVEVRQSVRFRLYVWGGGGGGGQVRIDNVNSTVDGRGFVIRGEPMPANLETGKTFSIFSENGADCGNLAAVPPAGPQPPAAIPGACIAYRLEITNTGGRTAHDVDMVATFPGVLTIQAAGRSGWDETAPAPGAFAFTSACDSGGCTVELANGRLAAGATATVTIRATIQ